MTDMTDRDFDILKADMAAVKAAVVGSKMNGVPATIGLLQRMGRLEKYAIGFCLAFLIHIGINADIINVIKGWF